jgi:radical SAM superfamily enzyme YgiQ (UPF0313 family)
MSKIKFLIVCPAPKSFRVDAKNTRPARRMRVFRFSMLGPQCVAAAAPDHVQVRIVDEHVEPIDFDTDTDLVGISFMTFSAPRAYEIARAFKARGRTVIFGGYHPTLVPDEAIRHADAVCVGDAEPNLPQMIHDFERGSLKPFYDRPSQSHPGVRPDPTLIQRRQYIAPAVVQATRGCPHHCEFCSIAAFSRRRYQTRPVSEVVAEVSALRSRSFLFMDDNLVVDLDYARRLFRQLVPLRKRWYAQLGVTAAQDGDLVELMRRSGCRGVFVGFESLCQASLEEAGKRLNRVDRYRQAVARLHAAGIAVMGAVVLGFDHDTIQSFEKTRTFLREVDLDALQLTLLTPLPGTPLFDRFSAQGRIVDHHWEHYDLGHVVFRPRHMSAQELADGHARLLREFYSWPAIFRRAIRQWRYLEPQEIGLCFLLGVGYRYKLHRTGLWNRMKTRHARSSYLTQDPTLNLDGVHSPVPNE